MVTLLSNFNRVTLFCVSCVTRITNKCYSLVILDYQHSNTNAPTQVPALCDNDAKFAKKNPWTVSTKPHGHGDVRYSLSLELTRTHSLDLIGTSRPPPIRNNREMEETRYSMARVLSRHERSCLSLHSKCIGCQCGERLCHEQYHSAKKTR